MSIGKFEPSYFNAYSRPRHDNSTAKDDEVQEPSGQMYFNGFSGPANEQEHGNKNSEAEHNSEEEHNGDSKENLEKYIHIEPHPNGGASVVRVYDSEMSTLGAEAKDRLAKLFFEEVFREESDHVAKHVIGIVHGAVTYMPELVNYLAEIRPELDIKVGVVLWMRITEGGPHPLQLSIQTEECRVFFNSTLLTEALHD